MVSLTSLAVMAVVAAVLAATVARMRALTGRSGLLDLAAALTATLGCLLVADLLFVLRVGIDAASWSRDAAAAALLASPLAAALALRMRGRRSIPRALFASCVALAGVLAWLTLHLRGPGGWTPGQALLATLAAAVTVSAAACAGWWSKRRETVE